MIELNDGHASPGDRCHHVTPRGGVVGFTLLRADILDVTGFHPVPVVVAEESGLYSPESCYVDLSTASGAAAVTRASRRRWAERELAGYAELGGEGAA